MSAAVASAPVVDQELRDKKLRDQIAYCLRSPFYQHRFAEAGVDPESVRTVDDLNSLPIFVTPDVHRQEQQRSLDEHGHPFSTFLCAPVTDVVSVSSTSGTTGTPTFYPFTARDVEITNHLWQRAFAFVGIRPGDRVLQGFGLSMYLAGVPVVRALESMGAMPIPVGAEAGSEKLLQMAQAIHPRVLACTPSYAEHLAERAPELLGTEAASLGIEIIVCAGEPGAGLPEVRDKLEDAWGAQVFDLLGGAHGIMMASGPTSEYHGMYVLGDDYSVSTQLVDPVTKEAIEVTDGAVGERVKTALEWQGTPPLRYSVGDIYQVLVADPPEGPTGPRVRVMGRVDDLLIVKGVKLYPAAVKNLVNSFVPEVTGELRILLDEPPPLVKPPLRLRVEYGGEPDEDEQASLARRLEGAMHDRLTVRPDVELVPPGTLTRTSHKQQLIEIVKSSPRREEP